MKKLILICALLTGLIHSARATDTLSPDGYEQLQSLTPLPENSLPALQGKPLVITFFASWCPPCTAEFRELNKLRAAIPAEKANILAINLYEKHFPDPTGKRLTRFLKRTKPKFPLVEGGNHAALETMFGKLDRIPTVFIFDADGNQTYSFIHETGASKRNSSFEEMLTALR